MSTFVQIFRRCSIFVQINIFKQNIFEITKIRFKTKSWGQSQQTFCAKQKFAGKWHLAKKNHSISSKFWSFYLHGLVGLDFGSFPCKLDLFKSAETLLKKLQFTGSYKQRILTIITIYHRQCWLLNYVFEKILISILKGRKMILNVHFYSAQNHWQKKRC